jgi:hypothetical protein
MWLASSHYKSIRENGKNSLPIIVALHFNTPSMAFAASAAAP